MMFCVQKNTGDVQQPMFKRIRSSKKYVFLEVLAVFLEPLSQAHHAD